MYILLCKEGEILKQYYNNDFIEFVDYDKYKYLGLVYPYMCIFVKNLNKKIPSLLMLSFDTKNRLQYKYNDYHIKQSQQNKITKIHILINNIDKVIKQLNNDILSNDRYKVILSCMAILTYKTGIRIGKQLYLTKYNSIGLSTLQKRHITFIDDKCIIKFIGKKGVNHEYIIDDFRVVNILKILYKQVKNQNDFIFQLKELDKIKIITNIDFNNYINELFDNKYITSKDFRTLLANIIFLQQIISNKEEITIDKLIRQCIKYVAETLHNTKAVSKKSYIFEMIINYINKNGLLKLKKLSPINALIYIFKNTN